MTNKGKFCTLIIKNWKSWAGCFDMAKWGIICFIEKQGEKVEMKFDTMDKGKVGTHTFSIEEIKNTVYVGIDNEKQPIVFRDKKETNIWAVENAIKVLLNRIYKQQKSPA